MKDTPHRILGFTIENFKVIRLLEAKLPGRVTQIKGANGAGKSSVLEAFVLALRGGKAMPDMPVRKGAEYASIVVETNRYKITLHINKAGTMTVKLMGLDGEKVSKPREVIDAWMGDLGLDPVQFADLLPAVQTSMLLQAAGAYEQLAAAELKCKAAEEKRTELGRIAKTAEAVASTMPVVDGPDEEQSSQDLIVQIEEARKANNKIVEGRKWVDEQKRLVAQAKAEIEDHNATIAELQEKVASKTKAIALVEEKIAYGDKRLADMEVQDVDALTQKLYGLENANKLARERAQAKKAAADAEEKRKAYATAERAVEDAREARKNLLGGIKLPVPGLAINEDGVVLYNRVPLSQASTAERIRIGVGIALAQNPEMKLVLIHRGESLDDNSMKVLDEVMEEYGAMALVERVVHDADPAAGVEIVSGEVSHG